MFTKRWLTEHGFGFEELNTDEHPELIDEVKSHGFNGLPVVVTPDEAWQGYRPNKLNEFLK